MVLTHALSSATEPEHGRAQSIFSTRAPSEHEYLQLGSVLNDKRRAPAPLRAVAFNPGAAKRAGGAGAARHWVSLRVALGSFI